MVASWRTGSSFIGQLIQSSPGVFYSFEPLHYLQYQSGNETDQLSNDPMSLVNSMLDCRFTADYLRHHVMATGEQQTDGLTRLWSGVCEPTDRELCLREDFVRDVCEHHPVRLVKEVRLTLDQVAKEIKTNENSSG